MKDKIKNDKNKLTIIKEYYLSVNSSVRNNETMFLEQLSHAENSEQNPIIFNYEFLSYLLSFINNNNNNI